MNTHSENDITAMYIGTALINGRLCHRWLDGTTLPVLSGASDDGDDGGDGDGDGDDGDGDDDDDSEGDDDDSGDDDDEEEGKQRKPSAKSLNKAHRDAAKYRTRLRERTTERDTEKSRADAAEAKLAKLEKDGITEDAVKAKFAEMEATIAEQAKKLEGFTAKELERRIESQVSEEVDDLGIDADVDYVIIKLRKNDMLTVDEDGDIEDLSDSLKKLLKKGVLKKVASGDDSENNGNSGSSSGGSGATRSGRSTKNVGRKRDGKVDRAALMKKYPALQR